MQKRVWLLALALPMATFVAPAAGHLPNDAGWPWAIVSDDGTVFGLAYRYQYDVNATSNDDGQLGSAHGIRRDELGIYLKRNNVYDAVAVFDFQPGIWKDVYVHLQSKQLFGGDAGSVRIGYSKTLLGLEANTGSGATTFLETALPTEAFYAGRRIGAKWLLVRPAYLLEGGYYSGGDLQGDLDGQMTAARVAWTPRKSAGDVLHLGMAASRETPDATTDGRGVLSPPAARLGSRPETGLLMRRLADTGDLTYVDYIDRRSLEALWIGGPWSLQGEYLRATVRFSNGRPDFRGDGYYAFASWMLTGESRNYADGNLLDIVPRRACGAVELALRYSELDLNDGAISAGKQSDWTVGANWYLGRHLKLQADYVYVHSDRRDVRIDPDIVELRAQVSF